MCIILALCFFVKKEIYHRLQRFVLVSFYLIPNNKFSLSYIYHHIQLCVFTQSNIIMWKPFLMCTLLFSISAEMTTLRIIPVCLALLALTDFLNETYHSIHILCSLCFSSLYIRSFKDYTGQKKCKNMFNASIMIKNDIRSNDIFWKEQGNFTQ